MYVSHIARDMQGCELPPAIRQLGEPPNEPRDHEARVFKTLARQLDVGIPTKPDRFTRQCQESCNIVAR